MSGPPTSILSLPPEITQRIFGECIPTRSIGPTPGPQTDPPTPLSQQAPLLLTQICRDWRAITLDTPQLWDHIAVNDSTGPVSPLMVGLWMSRGGRLPRDISFTSYDEKQGADFLDESMEYCHLWRDVELSLEMESFSALVAHHGPFPLLRSLSLSTTSRSFSENQTIPILDAPFLREVTLVEFPFLTVDVPWGQLTTLKMTAHQVDGISVLQHCTGLVDLSFFLMDPSPAPLGIPPLALHSLTSLKTMGRSILPFLVAPNLESLDIWGPGFSNDVGSLIDSLHELVARSACPLSHMSFRVPPILAAQFKALLRAAPSVTELKLTFQFLTGLNELITVLRSPDVLPRLTTLRIMDNSWHAEAKMPLEPLLDMLRKRQELVEGRATLKMLSLHIWSIRSPGLARVPTNATMQEFAALADKGLSIHIVSDGTVLMDQ